MSLLDTLLSGQKPEKFPQPSSPSSPSSPSNAPPAAREGCRPTSGVFRDGSYSQRAQEALKRICEAEYLPGTMRWLERAVPNLHRRVTQELPEEISRLWDKGAPLDRFQAVLDSWVTAHQTACSLYRRHIAGGSARGSEAPVAPGTNSVDQNAPRETK